MAETMGPAVFLEAGSTGENVYPVSQRTGTGECPEGHLLTQKDLARGRRSWTRVADVVCQRTGNLGQQWQPQGRSGFAPDNTLRDMARFGEMIRLDGRFNGQQIVPQSVIEDIRRGGNREHFAKASYKTRPGWSYRDMWWMSHDSLGRFAAYGIHGQGIFIYPNAEMVVVRFASHPVAANASYDATTLPAFDAVAKHLMALAR
jgi:CubicO group peptidase (beta-lactamase class C family)